MRGSGEEVKMRKRLNVEEIEETYKDEWVLLIDPDVSGAEVIGGEVALHSKDRGEVHRRLSEWKGSKALIYTGKIPEEVEVLLNIP